MNKILGYVAAAMAIAVSVFGGLAPAQEIAPSVKSTIEWYRIIGGVIGTLGTLIGVVLYFIALNKTQALAAAQNASKIYEGERDAILEREKRVTAECQEVKQQLLLRDHEIVGLRARTDLARVIELQGELLVMKRAHDAATVRALDYIAATTRAILEKVSTIHA